VKSNRFFINGHSILASSVVLSELLPHEEMSLSKWVFSPMVDQSYFEITVKKAYLESWFEGHNLSQDLAKKHLEGEFVTFESTTNGDHYMTLCGIMELKAHKNGLVSFVARVSGQITITHTGK
tara:strand:+ start:556 stop:924 length:369 start_codon:yes stop_codon:yes gene_type:complete